ncbi:MAG: radical SAM protein [Patescibacteria group bacterium]
MKVQTFSIIAGSEACNARCPFCISKMTPASGVEPKEPEVNWRNFEVACRLAKGCGVTTAMFTGKGEPTIFPDQITKFLGQMEKYEFPLIELQTNGILLAGKTDKYDQHLKTWYEKGMTTIAISIVHYEPEKNREVYLPHKKNYFDLPRLIATLHRYGFSVRLTCIAANGFIDDSKVLDNLMGFAKENKVEQLTLTPVNKPDAERNCHVESWNWTTAHCLRKEQLEEIKTHLESQGAKLIVLPHGAIVYDLHGQNICLNNCLNVQPDADGMRNIIFFPDGHIRYYWQYEGAILL